MNGAIPRCGLIVLMALAGCARNPPDHIPPQSDATLSLQCKNAYEKFDGAIGLIQPPRIAATPEHPECAAFDDNDQDADKLAACLKNVLKDDEFPTQDAPCWNTSWEQHDKYDLFFTEFDDEGWAADVRAHMDGRAASSGQDHWISEQDVLFNHLASLVKATGPEEQPVDVVIYTHGWHGSPKPDNYYVVLFRAFLNSLVRLDSAGGKPRHVVGVFVGWRGDSVMFPSKYVSVWDRKQAAETVSAGAVQGLFERMHRFYLDNSCHVAADGKVIGDPNRCGQVRMLTIGHSFGALINFRSLLGNMEAGLTTSDTSHVYSFGDMVVLLNPAFEGVRYEPLFSDAMRRQSFVGPTQDNGGAQLPVVVTLQSEGDRATREAFPVFREVTSRLENAVGGHEKDESIHAMGWVDAFATHRLCLDPAKIPPGSDASKLKSALCSEAPLAAQDNCDQLPPGDPPPDYRLKCRVGVWKGHGTEDAYTALAKDEVYMGDGMSLLKLTNASTPFPAYFPYWVIKVDKRIMADHDDIWNTKTTDVILQLYRAVVNQSDVQANAARETAAAAVKQ
jgi:hypothetical protein